MTTKPTSDHITLRGVDPKVWRKLKAKAALRNITMKDYVNEIFAKEVSGQWPAER